MERFDRRQVLAGALGGTFARVAPPLRAEAANPLLAPDAIRADLDLLGEIYGHLHPGLQRYLPADGFARLIDRAMVWGARPRTRAAVYAALARLTAALRCGHSQPNPFNQSRAVQAGLIGRADRLPVCARWVGTGRAADLVITDPLATPFARGDVIRSIDGVPTQVLLAHLLPLTRADGHNDAKRLAQLDLVGGQRFAAFDVLRSVVAPGRGPGIVAMSAGHAGVREVRALDEGARGAAPADPLRGWRFAIDARGLGVLTMPSWAVYDSKADWRGFVSQAMDRLIETRARGLIIDLRANEGGLDCGDAVLARLITRPLADPGWQRLLRFRETPGPLRPYLDTWDPSFHRLGAEAVPVPGRPGFLALPRDASAAIEPSGTRFAGPVAVLVGPNCSSATFRFAGLVRAAGVGRLIGAPTGGNRRGINGGAFFFARLPRTGLEVDVPLIGTYPDRPQPDAGIVPDLIVRDTVASIAAGHDPAMAAARNVLAGG